MESVATVWRYANGSASIAWSDRAISELPDGTKLYPYLIDQQVEIDNLRTIISNLVVSLKGKYIVSTDTLEAIDAARAALESRNEHRTS